MASSSSWSSSSFTIFVVLLTNLVGTNGFNSIISFGDSLADTGNSLYLDSLKKFRSPPHFAVPPYGETFFHHPTGRFSDGRLVIDFLAEGLGLPLVAPYFGDKNANFSKGVNFAVGGATALEFEYLLEKGVHNPETNVSLSTQLAWFKQMLSSLCNSPSECKEFLQNSLILMGEIGGNDFNHAFLSSSKTKEEVESFVPEVINIISSAIQELIEFGARTLLVPGNAPIGCSPGYLTKFMYSNKQLYDPKTGCIDWLNQFSQQYNHLLQKELQVLRDFYPSALIIYADYYTPFMRFYTSPMTHGFREGELVVACCGAGGPYNFNSSALCGNPHAINICTDPSFYVSWDGIHYTEAAYRWIATGILDGTITTPPLKKLCLNTNVNHSASEV